MYSPFRYRTCLFSKLPLVRYFTKGTGFFNKIGALIAFWTVIPQRTMTRTKFVTVIENVSI